MLLSICVPTYNRSQLLADTINNIYASIIHSRSNEVEVLISDNASTDDTPEVIKELQGRYPTLKAHRNSENVIDENFFIAAKAGRGKYAWVFGDDDLMQLQTVSSVLANIKEGYSHIVVNYSIWDKEMKVQVKPFRYTYREDLDFADKNLVLAKFSTALQFISATIFNKSIFFESCPADYKQFHQFGNSFLLATYTSISKCCYFKFISEPLVRYRGYNSDITTVNHWYNVFIVGNSIFLNKLTQYGYQKVAIRRARTLLINEYLIPDLVYRKKTNQTGMAQYIPRNFYLNTKFLVVGFPILVVPGAIFKLIYNLFKRKF